MSEAKKSNELPESLKHRYSMKAVTLASLKTMINILNDECGCDYQALLMTSYGLIKGDIVDSNTNCESFVKPVEGSSKKEIDFSSVVKLRNDALKAIESESNTALELIGDSAVLSLKNVSIYRDDFNTPVFLANQLMIFVDQIISFAPVLRNHLDQCE